MTLPFKTTQKYDVLRNHSRYDFGNSCASKRRELHSLPIGWEKKTKKQLKWQEMDKRENEDEYMLVHSSRTPKGYLTRKEQQQKENNN